MIASIPRPRFIEFRNPVNKLTIPRFKGGRTLSWRGAGARRPQARRGGPPGAPGFDDQPMTPIFRASATAWVRLRAPSFTLMLRRWVRTVLSLTNSFSAMALLL